MGISRKFYVYVNPARTAGAADHEVNPDARNGILAAWIPAIPPFKPGAGSAGMTK
jgi:hypothetical protein